ncbi:bi-domain-containing oxidoreductase [Salinicoccus bachuensis]|uniref:Bi-domain-containing oxidoreductase n=1 Tax=Salinicoccus bachuensis TaxID=3136731 RepID=A0ABZ3CK29_9STAP
MKQLLNSFGTGEVYLENISKPTIDKNKLLIKNHYSAVSVGTERMLVDFGKANYFQKARQQPEKVKEVINKVKTDGLNTTYNAVKSKLDQPIPLGYSSCGEVLAVGENCKDFEVGDFVISNGAHAEVVAVNKNLVANVPGGVSLEQAAFTVISTIPLQGIRLLQVDIGETVVVTGLGLMGLIASQILMANGCKVIATDFDSNKVEIAKSFGVDAIDLNSGMDIVDYVKQQTGGFGSDKVLITASTKSNDPIMQAAEMVRKRGKIVLVGVVGLDIDRTPFYEKEVTFQVSSSYGPGRYDSQYEEGGIDYPYGYVRWTENRNFQAILDLLKTNRISFDRLITHRFRFEEADKAYEELSNTSNVIGGLFEYDHSSVETEDIVDISSNKVNPKSHVTIGMIGAGNYSNQTLLPKIDNKFRKKIIASSGGMSSTVVGKKHGFESATTNVDNIMNDDEINTVIVTTRHNSHYKYVKEAMENNKSVFVEKPLALTHEEIDDLVQVYNGHHVMVGFNRRYSPLVEKMKELFSSTLSAKFININVNAGQIPKDHWSQDHKVGGGRLIGEACHFVDLAKFLADSKILNHKILSMYDRDENFDTFSIILKFEDGSLANINYYANGSKSFPKEHVHVSCEDKILEIDNFKVLRGFGFNKFKKMKSANQDKGHEKCINEFLKSTKTNQSLIPFEDIVEVSRVSIDLDAKMRN